MSEHAIPQDEASRKAAPMYRGLLGYFPYALFAVAAHSQDNDTKHNPDSADGPTWARGKSTDHLDAIVRHLAELHMNRDYHLAAIAWRALAALQEHGEVAGFAQGASSSSQQKPVGWIEWRGGKCPVDGDCLIDTKSRNGAIFPSWKAKAFDWEHGKCDATADIVAYRVVSE